MVTGRLTQGSAVRRAALFLAGGLVAVGCGQRLDLPEQPPTVFVTPEPGTYSLKTVWELPAPGDMAVAGLFLFVVENKQRVAVYYSTRGYPARPSLVSDFENLTMPVRVAVAKRDSTFVVVADSADMRLKIYYWLGGKPLFSFTDSLWRSFAGLAADRDLHIYVADAVRNEIRAYDRWGRRLRIVSDYGTGSGYVISPHALAHNGEMLIVADTGKNWVQRLEPDTSNVAAILEPIGFLQDLLLQPQGVAVDPRGEYVYVADTGHDRVLKFQLDGAFADTVYSAQKIALDPPLEKPCYLCARDSLVYVSDTVNHRLALFQLTPP